MHNISKMVLDQPERNLRITAEYFFDKRSRLRLPFGYHMVTVMNHYGSCNSEFGASKHHFDVRVGSPVQRITRCMLRANAYTNASITLMKILSEFDDVKIRHTIQIEYCAQLYVWK